MNNLSHPVRKNLDSFKKLTGLVLFYFILFLKDVSPDIQEASKDLSDCKLNISLSRCKRDAKVVLIHTYGMHST